jgi:hypothetical protein
MLAALMSRRALLDVVLHSHFEHCDHRLFVHAQLLHSTIVLMGEPACKRCGCESPLLARIEQATSGAAVAFAHLCYRGPVFSLVGSRLSFKTISGRNVPIARASRCLLLQPSGSSNTNLAMDVPSARNVHRGDHVEGYHSASDSEAGLPSARRNARLPAFSNATRRIKEVSFDVEEEFDNPHHFSGVISPHPSVGSGFSGDSGYYSASHASQSKATPRFGQTSTPVSMHPSTAGISAGGTYRRVNSQDP